MGCLVQEKVVRAVSLVLVTILLACVSPSRRPLPANNPFQTTPPVPESSFGQGIASGDVTSHSALVWVRTQVPNRVEVTWWPQRIHKGVEGTPLSSRKQQKSIPVETNADQDFTKIIPLKGLEPGTSYEYMVKVLSPTGIPVKGKAYSKAGEFSTLPDPEIHRPFQFIWSGDLGGQGHCRRMEEGYRIFDTIRRTDPSFAILLGDLVYADDRCSSPPNLPGADFIAHSLADYRAKHRYQREDAAFQRFLATIPVYAVWDDHEVVNNFSGMNEPLMPLGRQAFREYWPIEDQGRDPHRMYRRVQYGADIEIFLLDTRQYRSANSEPDGLGKTMLGQEQLAWLIKGLVESSSTWKVIVTSVPLGIQKGGHGNQQGNDSWARGKNGTGFYRELHSIVSQILTHQLSNVLWLSGDVHFAQANAYDPNKDGVPDFHEFTAGPLSAATRSTPTPVPDLNPTTLYSGGGFTNFGIVEGDQQTLTVRFMDATGMVRFEHTIPAKTF